MTQGRVETDRQPWPRRHPALSALGGLVVLTALGWYVITVMSGDVPTWSYVVLWVLGVGAFAGEVVRWWRVHGDGGRFRPGMGAGVIGVVALAAVVAAIARAQWTLAGMMALVGVVAGTMAASGRRRW